MYSIRLRTDNGVEWYEGTLEQVEKKLESLEEWQIIDTCPIKTII